MAIGCCTRKVRTALHVRTLPATADARKGKNANDPGRAAASDTALVRSEGNDKTEIPLGRWLPPPTSGNTHPVLREPRERASEVFYGQAKTRTEKGHPRWAISNANVTPKKSRNTGGSNCSHRSGRPPGDIRSEGWPGGIVAMIGPQAFGTPRDGVSLAHRACPRRTGDGGCTRC